MRKRLVAGAVMALALCLLLAVAVSAQGGTGSLSGQVLNGTPGGSVPGVMTITLHSFDTETALDPVDTLADAQGRFRFDGLAVTETMQYALTTDFLSITYASDLYSYQPGQSEITATLSVYETTESSEGVSFDRLHIILQPGTDGTIGVQEIYVINNLADRTFIGTEPTGGHIRITGQYTIPVGATDLTLEDQGSNRFVAVGDGFVDTLPVAPGQGASQVVVDYKLAYTGDRLRVTHALGFPTGGVQYFVPGETLAVVGSGIEFQRTMGSGAQTYKVYQGPAIGPGGVADFEITGLGKAERTAFPTGLVLAIAGALVLLIAVAVGLPLLRGRRSATVAAGLPGTAESVEARRLALVDEIARLDDDRDAGLVAEADYESRRALLKAEVLELTQTLSKQG
jgi:hypothetical protein